MDNARLIDRQLQLFVFLILLASYLLVYIPTPDSADGDAILAVSAALVRTGSADISMIGAQDALFEHDMSRMGVFGADGALYSKKGLAPSLALLPFTLAAQVAPWLQLRATAMLFNPVVTALTGALLYSLARALGFQPRSAVVAALLYGWATTAAVYTKTLFGEPLAALLISIAVLGVLRWSHQGESRNLILAGAALGIAVGINLTYLVTAAIVGSFIFISLVIPPLGRRAPPDMKLLLQIGMAFALPVIIALCLIALYNIARFGSPLTSGYYFGEGEGFNRPFLLGIYGLTLSPYRGLLWYSPIVLLALPGAWFMLQKLLKRKDAEDAKESSPFTSSVSWGFTSSTVSHPRAFVLLISALIAAQFSVYASWWSWHGGVVWGPRFILPVLPLIVLFITPVIERTFNDVPLRLLLIGLAALSIGVQITGMLLSPYPFYGVLSGRYGTGDMSAVVATMRDEILTDPGANAVIGHFELLTQGAALDPAWLRGEWLIALSALVLASAAVWMLRTWSVRTPLISLLACLAALNVVAASQLDAPDVEAARRLESTLDIDAPALVASNHYGSALLDIESRRILSMPAPTAPDDPLAAPMWQYAQTLTDRLWYVTWFPPADDANWLERSLWQNAAFGQERAIDGHRALLFHFSAADAGTTTDWRFGHIRLDRYGIAQDEDDLRLTLVWEAVSADERPLQFFVHIIDDEGNIIAQQDRAPLGGYRPASSWQPGEMVHDRLYFPNAQGANALRIGWVDPTSQDRLAVFAADGTRQPNDYILIPISEG